MDGGEIIDLAADVNSRTQHHVLHQRHIGEPQDLTGMDQSLGTIYWFGFTNVDEIARSIARSTTKGAIPSARPHASDLSLAGRRLLGGSAGGIASAMSKADGCDGMLACPVAQRSPALSTARVKAPLSSAAVIRASAPS